jgi:CheY-like chemotaxis protein
MLQPFQHRIAWRILPVPPAPILLDEFLIEVQPIGQDHIPDGAVRRRLHLAIPPVAALSPFSYKSTECVCRSLRGAQEGVRKPMATILLIDDEESVRMLFQVALERAGYRVLTAENGKHGLRLLEHQEVDLIFVDIFMPEMDGLELIPLLRKTRPANKIIAISGGSGQMNHFDTAKYLGADDTLKKPFSLQELLDAVSSQLK